MASFTLDQESVGSLLSFQNLLLVLTLPALLSWAVLLFKYRQLSRFPSANVLSATSPFWLLWQARKARRSTAVMDLHQKTGSDFVRLTQRHVSIARREAVAPIYGHSSGLMKSGFYDAFEAVNPALFPTRNRSIHARKRKMFNPAFSNKSLLEFEEFMNSDIGNLSVAFTKISKSSNPELNFVDWSNFLAFDVIGNLAFGANFGFVNSGRDDLGLIHILDTRGEYNSALGVIPWIKPYIKRSPLMLDGFWRQGLSSLATLEVYGRARLAERQASKTASDRRDLFWYLLNSKDEDGKPISQQELVAEAISFIVGGSDTTSTTMTHFVHELVKNPKAAAKLYAEVDSFFDLEDRSSPDFVAGWEVVSKMPYLEAFLNETMRVCPTSAVGLERIVPAGGKVFAGEHFEEGTIVSVPTNVLHLDPCFGDNVEAFDPDRWINVSPDQKQDMLACFQPFSTGPRACIGRNVAWMEMKKALVTVISKFTIEKGPSYGTPEYREGFFVKLVSLPVVLKARV